MPKKFKGENSKAVEARARKTAARNEETERKQREAEDAYWADDDKLVNKKLQRKDDKEKKRLEQLERKQELARLHDEEQQSLKSGAKAKSKQAPAKVTRHQLERRRDELEAQSAAERAKDKSITVVDEVPIEENMNKLQVEGEARNVDEALIVLSTSSSAMVDKHPEKRVRAAYQEFEDRRMPVLKQENPNLRLSQLRQMLKKEWQKSPENPLNARLLKH